jgi:hypothetical protein
MVLSVERNVTYFPNAVFAMSCFSIVHFTTDTDLLLTEVSNRRDSLLHRAINYVVTDVPTSACRCC